MRHLTTRLLTLAPYGEQFLAGIGFGVLMTLLLHPLWHGWQVVCR